MNEKGGKGLPPSKAPAFSTRNPFRATRHSLMGFCFLLTLLNYLDRVVISFAIVPIQKEFALNNAQFGLLTSAFAFGTLSVNGLSGWLLDRAKVRVVWTCALLVWSAAMILQGLTSVLLVFLGLRFILGLGEGVNFPAMSRTMADEMKPTEIGSRISIGLLGVPLALLIGGPLLSHAIAGLGWRVSFMILGGAGILLALIWLKSAPTSRPHSAQSRNSWSGLWRNPTLMATSWSFFAFGYVLFFGLTWLPGYLEQTYDMNLKSIGWFSVLPWALALVLIPWAGWFSDRIMRRTGSVRAARVHLIWVGQLLAVLAFGALLFTWTPMAALICLSLAIGFAMMPNAAYYAICADLFPAQTGAATGIIVTFFSAAGIVSPLLTGWLSDLFDGFGAAIGALIVIVGSAVLGMLIFARPEKSTDPSAQARIGP